MHIRKVVHAYKNLFESPSEKSLGDSDDCNHDNNINCYSNWDKQSDGVAVVLLSNGDELCSGSLLNNTAQNFRPFFLSAFHCIDSDDNGSLSTSEKNDAENWMFKFQYKVTECNGNTVRTSYTYNRANFRAAWNNTDFALMELKESPLGNQEITWLGWDRSGSTPSEGTGIHHPNGDVMKVAFAYDKLNSSSWPSNNNHWLLYYDEGVVEHGSSGSPLFNENKRVVGQLHGNQHYDPNQDYCDQPRAEYGKFHLSWNGGETKETQLKHWLDPIDSGTQTLNTIRSPNIYIAGDDPLCSGGSTYNIYNLPSGTSVAWSATPSHLFTNTGDTSSTFITAWDGSGVGTGTITATLTGDFGSAAITKDIWVGRPKKPVTSPSQSSMTDAGVGDIIPVDIISVEGGDKNLGNWSASGTISISNPFLNPGAGMIFDADAVGYGFWYVNVSNECGTSYNTSGTVDVSSSGGGLPGGLSLTLSPNPVSSEMTVTVEEETNTAKTTKAKTKYQAFIYHSVRGLVYTNVFMDSNFKISANELEVGTYILKVVSSDGNVGQVHFIKGNKAF